MQTPEFFTKAVEKLDIPWAYSDREAGWLIFNLRKRRPVHFNFLEIGTYKGGSLFGLNVFLNIRKSSFCDLHPREDRDELLKELECPQTTELTKEFLEQIGPIDLLHLDGDHTREGLQEDWDLVFPYLEKGAFIIIHDITAPDVAAFISSLEGQCRLSDKIEESHGVALLYVI